MNPYAEAHAPQTCLSANSSTLAFHLSHSALLLYQKYRRLSTPEYHLFCTCFLNNICIAALILKNSVFCPKKRAISACCTVIARFLQDYEALSFYSRCLFSLKYCFVSCATTPERTIKAMTFGNAIKPLKMSAVSQTASTVRYGPINTATMYSQR